MAVLVAERVILRDFEEQDWPAVHEWNSDPETVRYLTYDCDRTEAAAQALVCERSEKAHQRPREDYELVVVLKESNQPIGEVGLHVGSDGQSARMGYRIHPNQRGRGFGTEAVQRVLAFGFQELGLHRVKVTVDPANEASLRLVEKVGLRYEGLARDEHRDERGWQSEAHFALLADEWQARQNAGAAQQPPGVFWDQVTRDRDRQKPPPRPGSPIDCYPVLLRSDTLILREFTKQDGQQLGEIAAGLGAERLGSRLLAESNEAGAQAYVRQQIAAAREKPRTHYGLVITRGVPEQILGEIHLNSGWLTYQMRPDTDQRSSVTHAIRMMLGFGFETLHLHRIAADCPASNVAAARVIEEAGMEREAHFREVRRVDGEWHGLFSYAILAADWKASSIMRPENETGE